MISPVSDAAQKTPLDHSELFADLLRGEFGERALRVAEIQRDAAVGAGADIWRDIVNRLRR